MLHKDPDVVRADACMLYGEHIGGNTERDVDDVLSVHMVNK